jgi:hypothetical protein
MMVDGGPSFFPGEGRGPVGTAGVTTRSIRFVLHSNWAPAFAGEGIRGEGGHMSV